MVETVPVNICCPRCGMIKIVEIRQEFVGHEKPMTFSFKCNKCTTGGTAITSFRGSSILFRWDPFEVHHG